MDTVTIAPYISIPAEYKVTSHYDLEAQIRNKIITAYARTQAPVHIQGWVCYEIQEDNSLVEIRARDT